MPNASDIKKRTFLANWQDEMEAAMLYAKMAEAESNPRRKGIYTRLSEIEKRHAAIWENELKRLGVVPKFTPGLKARLIAFAAKVFSPRAALEVLERGEGSAIASYSRQARMYAGEPIAEHLRTIAMDEKSHSKILRDLAARPSEPLSGERWHQGGDFIRDMIFGVNDGLLSTFSLVAGVFGGAASNRFVLLSGLAGAIAGAISMAAGAYVSTKSARDVLEKHLELESAEIEMMPEAEREELQLMYELKGFDPETARTLSEKVMADSSSALDTMAKEELGFSPEDLGSPLTAALVSGISFIVGASVPILPFLLIPGRGAIYSAGALSLLGFFAIGAGRTIVTGKSPWRSGLEMFLIGTGAAAVTYLIGSLMGVSIAG